MLKELLVVGSVTATLLFVQPMQGQNQVIAKTSESSPLSLLYINEQPIENNAKHVVEATLDGGCFDNKNNLAFVNFDFEVKYDGKTQNSRWGDGYLASPTHPRQTLMTQKGTDDLISSLSVLPPKGGSSIRLMSDAYSLSDWGRGSGVQYQPIIDKDHPILKLYYAAVLENPKHSEVTITDENKECVQPWMWIYIINKNGNVIECINEKIFPSDLENASDWNKVASDGAGRPALWKDWDSIYIDMSQYVGQIVGVVFEVCDCAQYKYNTSTGLYEKCPTHEQGRLYCSMDCVAKTIEQTCNGANVTLTAPEGYDSYNWNYNGLTTRSISVPSTTAKQYTCALGGKIASMTIKNNEIVCNATGTSVTSTITPLTDEVSETIVKGGSVEIDGHTYTEAGNESKTWTHIRHTSDDECDVVVTVKLTVTKPAEPIHVYYERTIPQGVVFDFYGQDLTAEGEYEKTFKTTTGNDSTVHLKLHIQGETPKVDDEACFHMSTIGTTATASTVAVESNLIKQTGTSQEFFTWDMKIPSTPKRETYLTKEGLDELCPDLSLLPPGESTSVRLASEKYGASDMAKGSAVIFRYTIDANHPYVNIKYAGVLETPGHSIATMSGFKEFAQPYMTIYWTIDGVEMEHRSYFPSDANSVKAWKSFTDRHGNKAIWLDWQSVRLDLSQHVGKTLAIAMEVYDCAEENYDVASEQITLCTHHHLAHGYCHVNCEAKKEECSGVASVAQPICADAENFNINVNFTQGGGSTCDVQFSDAAKAQGFVDMTNVAIAGSGNVQVAIPHSENVRSINQMSYPTPNTYDAVVIAHTTCNVDLQMPVQFSLLYPSSIIVQRWNDVLAITNSTYNGGYNFSRIRWYHEGQEIAGNGEHNSYYYVKGDDSLTLAMGTEYWAELTREGESTGICTCHFIPEHKEGVATRTQLANVEVQSVARRDGTRRLELITEESGTYSLYDVCGRAIQSGYFGKEYGIMEISVPTTGNIFIMKLVTNSGQQDSKKLMIY